MSGLKFLSLSEAKAENSTAETGMSFFLSLFFLFLSLFLLLGANYGR
jgi:hypothetical protein